MIGRGFGKITGVPFAGGAARNKYVLQKGKME